MPRVPHQQHQSTNMEEIIKKGTWSPEEDQKLKSYIMRYGIWNWSHMPKFAGLSRRGKSCRLRWMNYLRPDVKRGPFTMEEVEIVIKTYQELGNRWSAIAARLPGRTDNEIKNFFHTHLKKHLGVQNDALTKRNKKVVLKKAKENDEMTNANKPSPDHHVPNITCEDQAVISNNYNLAEIRPVILESNPETTSAGINLGCQLCHFEYPHPCTLFSNFDLFHDQFDVLWDAEL